MEQGQGTQGLLSTWGLRMCVFVHIGVDGKGGGAQAVARADTKESLEPSATVTTA